MNAARRKELGQAIDLIVKIASDFEELKRIVDDAATEERDYYDNMPENMQSGDKGTTADDAASVLEEVNSIISDVDLDDLSSKIDDARGAA
jgi:division protein CdvB (Snf7/Vps24/ESCRT-III family)